MVSEQNADGFPAHARHQLPLHGFLSDEPHTPACLPRWWLATDPGDDTLALARVQPPLLAGARLLVQRRLQPLLLIAPGNRSHSFPGHAHVASHLRRCLSLIKLAQDQSPPQHPRRLPPSVQLPAICCRSFFFSWTCTR